MGIKSSKPKLSKEDLDFLKKNTSFTEEQIKEWYKGFVQDCPKGHLTKDQFIKVYKDFFPSGSAEGFCEHVFRTFDTDNSGFIDFKEFLLAINVTSSGTPEQKLEWAFRMYDIDGNGTIDEKEMIKIIEAIYEMLGPEVTKSADDSPRKRAKMIFEKMDVNNDKASSRMGRANYGHSTFDLNLPGTLSDGTRRGENLCCLILWMPFWTTFYIKRKKLVVLQAHTSITAPLILQRNGDSYDSKVDSGVKDHLQCLRSSIIPATIDNVANTVETT
ncbi:Calcium-binding protein NCS-1 [Dirofilaria immitis]|nr:Calcium-binding protein NCS-1 [Dirofilaria immitis]